MKHTTEALQWAAGMFDGDGCVGAYRKAGSLTSRVLSVAVGKAEKGMSALVHMQSLFGGRVCKMRDARGVHQAVFSWVVDQEAARKICEILAPYTTVKRAQMELAAKFETSGTNRERPVVATNVRTGQTIVCNTQGALRKSFGGFTKKAAMAWMNDNKIPSTVADKDWRLSMVDVQAMRQRKFDIAEQLKAMKRVEHTAISHKLSWPYIAGFFDSEGCIHLAGKSSVVLSVGQKWPAICIALQNTCGGQVSKRISPSIWTITRTSFALEFLRKILPFAVEKRPQILMTLDTVESHATKILAVRQLKGKQGHLSYSQVDGSLVVRSAVEPCPEEVEDVGVVGAEVDGDGPRPPPTLVDVPSDVVEGA